MAWPVCSAEGPFYISDSPENIDHVLLRKVADSRGRVRTFPGPPEMATESFFADPCLSNDDPLLLVNGEQDHNMIGAFNCSGHCTGVLLDPQQFLMLQGYNTILAPLGYF